jgi:hypothetical protein
VSISGVSSRNGYVNSSLSAHDVITDFSVDSATTTNDIIKIDVGSGQSIHIDNGTFSKTTTITGNAITGHIIDSHGQITFQGGTGNLNEQIDYLIKNDINGTVNTKGGSTVVFTNGESSYVYSQFGSNAGNTSGYSLVELNNVAASGLDIGATTVHTNNYVHIDHT